MRLAASGPCVGAMTCMPPANGTACKSPAVLAVAAPISHVAPSTSTAVAAMFSVSSMASPAPAWSSVGLASIGSFCVGAFAVGALSLAPFDSVGGGGSLVCECRACVEGGGGGGGGGLVSAASSRTAGVVERGGVVDAAAASRQSPRLSGNGLAREPDARGTGASRSSWAASLCPWFTAKTRSKSCPNARLPPTVASRSAPASGRKSARTASRAAAAPVWEGVLNRVFEEGCDDVDKGIFRWSR